jgi:hypothetical protein
MPNPATFVLNGRPDYRLAEFDALLHQLRDAIQDIGTRAEILAALQLEGRDLDVDELARELDLKPGIVEVVRELAAFGDEGHWVHEFGAVCIAKVNAGSDGMCDQTTFVFARRSEQGIEFFFEDENDGRGELGVRNQPLSMFEAIAMIDAVLLTQAGYKVGGDWRDVYLGDETMTVQVSSEFYPQLRAWYERATSEWLEAHSTKE